MGAHQQPPDFLRIQYLPRKLPMALFLKHGKNSPFPLFERISDRIVSSSKPQSISLKLGALRCFHCLLGRAMCFHLQLQWFQYHWTCRPRWCESMNHPGSNTVGFGMGRDVRKVFLKHDSYTKIDGWKSDWIIFLRNLFKLHEIWNTSTQYRLTWHDMVIWSLPVPPGIRSKVPWVACWMQLPSSLGVLRLGGIFGKKRRCHQFLMGDFEGGFLVNLWCFSRVREWIIQSTMSVGSQVVRQAVFPCFPYFLPAAVDPVCFRCCHICLSSPLSLGSRFVIGQPIFDLVWMD